MEKVTLKINQGIYSVEEVCIESDEENVYVLFIVFNPNGECDWSVGCSSVDDKERIYISVIDKSMEQTVISHALPLLLNALELRILQSDSPEERMSYQNVFMELKKKKL
jgi:hypothetical protein